MSSADTSRRPDWPGRARVWLVLDRAASAPRSVQETTERALLGGVDAVVCRLKDLPAEQLRPIAAEVRKQCREADTPFVMSHNAEIAVELGADAVQVGVADPPVAEVRKQIGAGMALGYSSHSVAEAREQLAAGADYVFLGPVFATPAKLKYGDPLGLETIRQALSELSGTLVCIGGITRHNLPQLVELGVRRVAAIAALQKDCDPRDAVRAFQSQIPPVG